MRFFEVPTVAVHPARLPVVTAGLSLSWREVRVSGMKTALTYGFALALGNALLTLLLYFTGLHDSPEKMQIGQWVGSIGGLAIGFTCLYLALRESRANARAGNHEWLFGAAFGIGVGTAAVAAVFALAVNYAYFGIINPDFSNVVQQAQAAEMEARGASAQQIEKAAPIMAKFVSPMMLTIMGALAGFIFSMLLAAQLALTMQQRHAYRTLLRYYAIWGLVLGLFVGFSQGAKHHSILLGLLLGMICGPIVQVAIAALVLKLAKYQPVAADVGTQLESNLPPTLA